MDFSNKTINKNENKVKFNIYKNIFKIKFIHNISIFIYNNHNKKFKKY